MEEIKKEEGIKEISEILDALDLVAGTAAEVLADGKITFGDLPSALKLVNNYKTFISAIDNAGDSIAEAKDLDESEMIALGIRIFALIKNTSKIIKSSK